ncbi:MAG: hypothetical protein JOY58_08210 [Solirubrobacterales bacterium]|nr:hypothetical protein [Solirubrobacterales bacterium]
MEVRMQDLAMSPAQAAALLQLAGVALEFEDVQTLARRTEGWPAALYLAALSLRDQGDTAVGLTRFRGDDRFISEYFRDEFLDQLSPEVMSFLTRASVLDELSGPLCDAVMERPSCSPTLTELARANPMIVPLGRNQERYRWHGLFRDALQAELRRTDPQLACDLHRRASTRYEQQGDVDRAIDHAFAAGDLNRAGDLLWANMTAYVAHGRNDAVQRWLTTLTFAQIADYAPLALVAAHSALMIGDLNGAQHWGLAAAGALERGRAPKDTSALEPGVELIRATAARVTPVEMGQAAARAYKCEPENSHCRAMCCLLKGAAEHLLGHRDSAKQHLEEGVETGVVAAPMVAALCLAQLVMIAVDEEDWDATIELGDQAAAVVRKSGIAQDPIAAIVLAASAAATARQGRADEAKRDLRHGAYLIASLGEFIPWYGVEARLLLARAALGVADTVRARTLLSEASRLARRTPEVASFRQRFDELWAQIDALAESALSGPSSLTIAELRILRFLPSHRSFREIAERLDVSVNTVKTHAHGIYRKLDAASRSEAVARASEAGLLGT